MDKVTNDGMGGIEREIRKLEVGIEEAGKEAEILSAKIGTIIKQEKGAEGSGTCVPGNPSSDSVLTNRLAGLIDKLDRVRGTIRYLSAGVDL